MKALTSEAQWNSHWLRFSLPRRVDLRSYYSSRCDRLFRSVVPRGGQRRFIDVGCGVGQWLIYFHETFGYEVVGVDSAPIACDLARRNLDLVGVPGEIIHGDISSTPLEKGSFDVVYSGGLIEHFDNPLPLVQHMSSLVKPGGLHIIFVPNLRSMFRHIRERLDPVSFEGHQEIRPEMLRTMLEQSGMQDIEIHYFGSIRLPHVRRRGTEGVGVPVSTPLWLAMRSLDRGFTSVLRRLPVQPEAEWLSHEIVALARAPIENSNATKIGEQRATSDLLPVAIHEIDQQL